MLLLARRDDVERSRFRTSQMHSSLSPYERRRRERRAARAGRDWRQEGLFLILVAPIASFGFTFMFTKGLLDFIAKGDGTYLLMWLLEAVIAAKLLWPRLFDEMM